MNARGTSEVRRGTSSNPFPLSGALVVQSYCAAICPGWCQPKVRGATRSRAVSTKGPAPDILECKSRSWFGDIWRVPNPPGANPLVAERAPWRSSQSRVTGGQQPIGNPYRFLSFLLHTWQPLCNPNSHSWGRLFQLPGG